MSSSSFDIPLADYRYQPTNGGNSSSQNEEIESLTSSENENKRNPSRSLYTSGLRFLNSLETSSDTNTTSKTGTKQEEQYNYNTKGIFMEGDDSNGFNYFPNNSNNKGGRRRKINLSFFVLSAFFIGLFIGMKTDEFLRQMNVPQKQESSVQQQLNNIPQPLYVASSIKEGSSLKEVLGQFVIEKEKAIRKVKDLYNYGENKYYYRLFNDHIKNQLFKISSTSKYRLVMRIQIKILQAFLNDEKTTFIWATSGDSAAAGHGNLFEQSFTLVMERFLKEPLFKSLGLNFQARNYAIGGLTSGPEVALCLESIYGKELDILAWDFSSTQSSDLGHHSDDLWANRASMHPTKPILFLVDNSKDEISTTGNSTRWDAIFSPLEKKGIGTMMMDLSEWNTELTPEVPLFDVEDLPILLKDFRCGPNDLLEGGTEEYSKTSTNACVKAKFKTKEVCGENVHYQTNPNNPGWKSHHLKGSLISLFLLETFHEALLSLVEEKDEHDLAEAQRLSRNNDDDDDDIDEEEKVKEQNQMQRDKDQDFLSQKLQHLREEEIHDSQVFKNEEPSLHDHWFSMLDESEKEILSQINPKTLYRRKSFCHTALIPSRARYEGVMTPDFSDKRDPSSGYSENKDAVKMDKYTNIYQKEFYYRGTDKIFLNEPIDNKLPIVFDSNDRQKCDALEVDHKDFFYVRSSDEWISDLLPTRKELDYFDANDGKSEEKNIREGLIMVCPKVCPKTKCPEETISLDGDIQKSVLKIKVNNRDVTSVKKLQDCYFLEGLEGLRWKSSDERYDISFFVAAKTGKNIKMSSIIIL